MIICVIVDSNNVVKEYGIKENDNVPYTNGVLIETDLDLKTIDIDKNNYKLVDNKLVELTEEEKASLFPTPVIQPTADEILRAKLIKDNASIQLQLSAQQKLNADILLKLAKVGGSTNV